MGKVVKVVFVNFLILFGLLVVLEVVFRILGYGYGNAPLENDPVLHHVNPSNYSFEVYTPNEEFGGHTVTYDETGKRISENSEEKEDAEEIWFFGDSFTAATQQSWENSFVGIVDASTDYNAINFGTSSYSPLLYLIQLRKRLKINGKAEIAFIQIYSNDISDDVKYRKSAKFDKNGLPMECDGGSNNWLKALARKSYLARVLRRVQLTLMYMRNEKESDEKNLVKTELHVERNPDLSKSPDFTSNIHKLDSILKAEKIEHYFFAIPSKYSCVSGDWETPTFSTKLNGFYSDNGYPFINLTERFKEVSKSKKVFYDIDIHCNDLGNSLIAEEVLTKIKE